MNRGALAQPHIPAYVRNTESYSSVVIQDDVVPGDHFNREARIGDVGASRKPGLPLMSRSERTWTLPHQASAMAEARRLVEGMCRGMPVERVDVARLLVSELTMNALQHGSGEVTLVVVREGGGLRVEVHDESRVMPVLVVSPSLQERGWGLQLVAAFANSWGSTANDDVQLGKHVWFTLS